MRTVLLALCLLAPTGVGAYDVTQILERSSYTVYLNTNGMPSVLSVSYTEYMIGEVFAELNAAPGRVTMVYGGVRNDLFCNSLTELAFVMCWNSQFYASASQPMFGGGTTVSDSGGIHLERPRVYLNPAYATAYLDAGNAKRALLQAFLYALGLGDNGAPGSFMRDSTKTTLQEDEKRALAFLFPEAPEPYPNFPRACAWNVWYNPNVSVNLQAPVSYVVYQGVSYLGSIRLEHTTEVNNFFTVVSARVVPPQEGRCTGLTSRMGSDGVERLFVPYVLVRYLGLVGAVYEAELIYDPKTFRLYVERFARLTDAEF